MKKKSIALLVATILATAYSIYLICYFFGATAGAGSDAEALGAGIATALVFPHILFFALGAVFGWIGYLARKTWSALVAAILYSVGTFFFLAYFMFGVPILIVGFCGYANQKKIKASEDALKKTVNQ